MQPGFWMHMFMAWLDGSFCLCTDLGQSDNQRLDSITMALADARAGDGARTLPACTWSARRGAKETQ